LDAAYGAGKPGLNLDNIRDMSVALPPFPEQHEIVRRVEALFRLADAIEARVVAGAHQAERLTQAILAKAFRGELVPTEAELARQEGRDFEPAAVLLSRLKAARRLTAAAPPHRQTRKGRKRQKA
jgi:type I restriction enzyme, S subunit